jgi:hypothetical protein
MVSKSKFASVEHIGPKCTKDIQKIAELSRSSENPHSGPKEFPI